MKDLACASGLAVVGSFLLVACGVSEPIANPNVPLDKEGLIAAADEACAESKRAFEAAGPRGITNEGVAAEVASTVRIYDERIASLEALQVAQELRPLWNRYLAGERAKRAGFQDVVEAATADDDDGVSTGFDSVTKAGEARDKAARELGFEVCGLPPEVSIASTGTGPAQDLVFVQPGDDVKAASRRFVEIAATGKCDAINRMMHSDAAPYSEEFCSYAPSYNKGATIVATEQYGPAGVAEVVAKDGTHVVNVFVVDVNGDRTFRKVTDVIHDSGGVRPAPENNDAEQVARETVAAIRTGDAAAFNRVSDYPDSDGSFAVKEDGFTTFGNGSYQKGFVDSIRSSTAEPQLLGINAAFALYLIQGDDFDYVMTFNATAGDGSKYRFSGFYPIPKP